MTKPTLRAGRTAFAALVAATLAFPVFAGDRTENVHFAAGAHSATFKGSVTGYDGVNYMLGANAGQMVHVLFSGDNGACYFNYWEPGADTAVHQGEIAGNEFSMRLSTSGKQRVQVYLMRSAARRNETCHYSVTIEITG